MRNLIEYNHRSCPVVVLARLVYFRNRLLLVRKANSLDLSF